MIMGYPPHFIRSQIWTKLPYPTHSFATQTIIVTGSNTGMGLEAARHFVRLGASKVILGVRNSEKGQAAKKSIEESEKKKDVVEVWELDLTSYESVQAFATRVNGLERLDVLVGNAGIRMFNWQMAEDDEITITVNVVSTFLLSLLVLPKLRETSKKFNKECVLTLTGSFVHYLTNLPEKTSPNIFEALKEPTQNGDLQERYNVSKMIELLCLRELSKRISSSEKGGHVTASIVNPGYVVTDIMRDAGFVFRMFLAVMKLLLGRTAEEGGRTLVHGAEGGDAKHGKYLDDCTVGEVSEWVRSDDGNRIQKKIWDELSVKLEKIRPGIMDLI